MFLSPELRYPYVRHFPEFQQILKLIEKASPYARINQLATVKAYGYEFPIHSFEFGSQNPEHPTLGLFGGVHGLERIGTQAVLSYLDTIVEHLKWDLDFQEAFASTRLVSIPLINPAGMFAGLRSNPNGVDLMRNAPVEANPKPPFLLGGHRISPKLPWYRGKAGAPLELESQSVVDFVKKTMFQSKAALVLDFHSGFGSIDRLWYPYAKTSEPFPLMDEVAKIKDLFDNTYPNHVYRVESQALSYTTHGDLWDYLFDEHRKEHPTSGKVFIPWTLEMGSWMWIRKNPMQLFSSSGPFNPVLPHRHKRTMRRHLLLIDFFRKAVRNYRSWSR